MCILVFWSVKTRERFVKNGTQCLKDVFGSWKPVQVVPYGRPWQRQLLAVFIKGGCVCSWLLSSAALNNAENLCMRMCKMMWNVCLMGDSLFPDHKLNCSLFIWNGSLWQVKLRNLTTKTRSHCLFVAVLDSELSGVVFMFGWHSCQQK